MTADTQMPAARAGRITAAMQAVARKESRPPEFIRDGVAAGRIVIPCNPRHAALDPIGIGRALLTKINANLGNSPLAGSASDELAKLRCAVGLGADAVMDLSTGAGIEDIRLRILAGTSAPVGTVPIYEAVSLADDPMDLTPELLLDVIEAQAAQGVDFMTLHAGLLSRHVPLVRQRLAGIVSRGGALLATWMQKHRQENPLFAHFDRVLDICRTHDVTISLGDGLRPGCLADASDAAQFGELEVLGDLVRRSRRAGVQAMVEGPGHIPLNEIEMNMRREDELCDGAPFYVLGPVVTDCAPGYDHITAAIGAAQAALHGAAMLCYVTPREHLGLPDLEDVRQGVVAFKIAAHAADVALGRPGARERDDAISRARVAFDWEKQFELALDPERARRMRAEALAAAGQTPPPTGDEAPYCTMCGPGFCSMRISRELRAP
ncbi:MAG: phosphomethylpyrimidine synthase ThiC [Kiritimatiellae bacterium]|nr:phosphomethylpyrimidine synthase ThiC [Kiritimatiellia bacterium]